MEERTPKPVIWGWVLTGGVLLFGGVLGFIPTCDSAGDCQSKFAAFWSAPPNEIGDTLAGFAGALAFVWIIVTVMLQSKELKAQREELRLTRSEMEQQREATQDMARSMALQADIFEQEKLDRQMLRADEDLNGLLEDLFLAFRRNGIASLIWFTEPENHETPWRGRAGTSLVSGFSQADFSDSALIHWSRQIPEQLERLESLLSEGSFVELPSDKSCVHDLLHRVGKILQITPSASLAMRVRLERIPLRQLELALQRLMQIDGLWVANEEALQ